MIKSILERRDISHSVCNSEISENKENGITLEQIQKSLAHSKIETTQSYAELTAAAMQESIGFVNLRLNKKSKYTKIFSINSFKNRNLGSLAILPKFCSLNSLCYFESVIVRFF
jgi:hypothetical protein